MRPAVLAAYVTVSLVWGSTYLAIRIGVQHLPPALFGGIRFTIAGAILLAFARALGRPWPRRPQDWMTAAVVGTLLVSCGNGVVIWAEQYVESGMAAILVVTGALWMAVFDAVIPGSSSRPTWQQFVGLLMGFSGTAFLVGGGQVSTRGVIPAIGLVGAAGCWALGSIYSKRHPVQAGPYMFAALQMLAGGTVMLMVGMLTGELPRLRFTPQGAAALAYLIVFGSLVAYTSYVYLLEHAQPAFVGTHGYVNTVVAVLLGWMLLDETVSTRTILAMVVILSAVVWVRRAERVPATAV